MSGDEYKKLRLHLRLLTIAIVLLAVLLVASLTHRVINPKSTSFPDVRVVNGTNGKDPGIDYSFIEQYIQSQIASLPKAQNGANGQSIVGPQGPQGTQGPAGKDGTPGANAPVLQEKVDPVTCQLLEKYDTSDIWTPLAQLPKPCEVL